MTTTKPKPVSATDTETTFRHRKSMLFCPDCGHASPTSGDWDLDWRGDSLTYRCPDCETKLESR